MWRKIEDQRFVRKEVDAPRAAGTVFTLVKGNGANSGGKGVPLAMRRWVHEDGRYAVHVPDADPEVLVLDAKGEVIREYNLPGKGTEPDATDPLKGAREVRAVCTPGVVDGGGDEGRWELLRGWS